MPTTTFCPPHPALLIPEIVSHILAFVAPDSTATTKKRAFVGLLQCLRVNQLWHDCAARLLWRDVSFDESNY
ncbi:hypothetical protein BDB00DRAFT_774509, partial [Zychaea mexicana]|uniref:uncharacterized protein n=1 Tax=Zychaea mexicana TaxID=64656 RepID=UPI0022FDC483